LQGIPIRQNLVEAGDGGGRSGNALIVHETLRDRIVQGFLERQGMIFRQHPPGIMTIYNFIIQRIPRNIKYIKLGRLTLCNILESIAYRHSGAGDYGAPGSLQVP
jgi:hypothetical protein